MDCERRGTMRAPHRPKSDDWKPQIIAATGKVIRRGGIASTTVADVAAAAGTTAGTVIYYFGTKNALIQETLKLEDDAFWSRLERAYESVVDQVERLCLLFLGCVRVDWDLSMGLWVYALRNPDMSEAHREFDGRTRTALATVIADGVRAGFFRDVVVDDVALRLSSLMDGLAVHVALADADVPRQRMLDSLIVAASLELGCDTQTLRETTARLQLTDYFESIYDD
jgi:AcrR family transcriptional regulator